MRTIFPIFCVTAILLQVQIIGLIWLDHKNLETWSAQEKLNNSIVNFITKKT